MASGDTLDKFVAASNEPPSSNAAILIRRNDHFCLQFPGGATDTEAVFRGIMPSYYANGGLTIIAKVRATSDTSGNVVIQMALERCTGQDIDSDGFAAFNSSGAVAISGTSGISVDVTVTFTDGADMDSVDVGDEYRLKVRRDTDDTSATDSVTNEIEISAIEVKET